MQRPNETTLCGVVSRDARGLPTEACALPSRCRQISAFLLRRGNNQEGRSPVWRLLCVVAVVFLCGPWAKARAQDIRPSWVGNSPAYPSNNYTCSEASRFSDSPVSLASGQEPLRPPIDPAYSLVGRNDLAAQVAELSAEVEKLKAAGAKATAVKYPTAFVGGRLMLDWASFSQNDDSKAQADNFQNGTEVRHSRFFIRGDITEVIDYKIQFEFASTARVRAPVGAGSLGISQTSFKDIYITVKELPVLSNVRVGHFKVPFGLEQLTSFRYSTFMERAMVMEGEIEGRRMGIAAFDHNEAETFTWAIGAFTSQIPENPPIFKNDGGGTAAIMRYTLLPWYDEATDGRGLLHLGISYAYDDIATGNTVDFFERPEAHLANVVIDAGELTDVNTVSSMGTEAALVYGPLSLQAEFIPFWLDRNGNPDLFFHGAYGYVSCFLTGENRIYDRKNGVFQGVKPFENFFRVRDCDGRVHTGKGAWEIAYRYSYMDLNSADVLGGVAGNHTIGLNWYLSRNAEVMWNYVHSEVSDHPDAAGVGTADMFQMRFRVYF